MGPVGIHTGDLAMKPKAKKKPKTKKQTRRILALIHRIAISLHAEAETLQEKTASLIAEATAQREGTVCDRGFTVRGTKAVRDCHRNGWAEFC